MEIAFEQLRTMNGRAVKVVVDGVEPLEMLALVEYAANTDSVFLTNNLGGRSEFRNDADLEKAGLKIFSYTPGKKMTFEQLCKMDGEVVRSEYDRIKPVSGLRLVEYAEKEHCVILWNNRGQTSRLYGDRDMERLKLSVYPYHPVDVNRNAWTAEWKEYTGADAGFHYCSKCGQQAFNYAEGEEVIEVLSPFCPNCARSMSPLSWMTLKKRLRGINDEEKTD